MLLADVVRTSAAVGATRSRRAKIDTLARTLRAAPPGELAVAVSLLSGDLPAGAVGIGWAALRSLPPGAARASLGLRDVEAALGRIAALGGPGSRARRRAEIDAVFAVATPEEQGFLASLLVGEVRQGAARGIMADAVAAAAGVPAADVRRAAMLAGDLAAAATAAIGAGAAGLSRIRLTPLRPLQPMLARSADGIVVALERVRPAVVEWKVDGVRLQLHRLDDEVRAFTRTLADVTDRVPEVVATMRALRPAALVLDAEVIALDPGGRPRSFQETMARFGSRRDVERFWARVPLSIFVFDCLYAAGEDLIDRPTAERADALAHHVPQDLVVPRLVTDDPDEAQRFFDAAVAVGHEGVMVKALDAPYEAGRRGTGWLKVKRAHTLDLVVLAAEWGHGRRQGWLSNLHLGARDPATGGFVMLGKTFKGLTDEMLAWQTERLLALETGRSGITVAVRPELVVEVAFDGTQRSSRYPGGIALRFARVKAHRPDKPPEDADTIATVQALAPAT